MEERRKFELKKWKDVQAKKEQQEALEKEADGNISNQKVTIHGIAGLRFKLFFTALRLANQALELKRSKAIEALQMEADGYKVFLVCGSMEENFS